MIAKPQTSLHRLGVVCGLAAGAWLGAGRGAHQAGDHGLFALPHLARNGRGRFRGALDAAARAEGNRIRLDGSK